MSLSGGLGPAIGGSATQAEELEELVRVLRAHAETERQCIYPWLGMQAEKTETPFGCDEAMF